MTRLLSNVPFLNINLLTLGGDPYCVFDTILGWVKRSLILNKNDLIDLQRSLNPSMKNISSLKCPIHIPGLITFPLSTFISCVNSSDDLGYIYPTTLEI